MSAIEDMRRFAVEAQREADRLRADLTCRVEVYDNDKLHLVWRYKTTKMRKGCISD